MTVSDLTAKLSTYLAGARVTLLDHDKGWLRPIEIQAAGGRRIFSRGRLRRNHLGSFER